LETEVPNADCQQGEETIDHIMSACPLLAEEQYAMESDVIECVLKYSLTYARK